MIRQIKKFYRTLKLDFELLFKRPIPYFDDDANKKYWDKRRRNYTYFLNDYQKFRVSFIQDRIDTDKRILDLGTGTGDQVIHLCAKGYNITCSDFSEESKHLIKENNLKFIKCDLSCDKDLELFSNYDVLLACEVLEHTQNPEKILNYFLQSSSTQLIFSVPNTGYFIYRLRLMFGSFPVQWRVHPGEHVRYWSLRDMQWWLSQLKIPDKMIELECYEGWPVINKLLPSIFSKGMIVSIKK